VLQKHRIPFSGIFHRGSYTPDAATNVESNFEIKNNSFEQAVEYFFI